MIICVYECNTRRHLVGLFDSIEDLRRSSPALKIEQLDVAKENAACEKNGYGPSPTDYNAKRAWFVKPIPSENMDDDGSDWPFGYCAQDGIYAYEVVAAPNSGIDWDED